MTGGSLLRQGPRVRWLLWGLFAFTPLAIGALLAHLLDQEQAMDKGYPNSGLTLSQEILGCGKGWGEQQAGSKPHPL